MPATGDFMENKDKNFIIKIKNFQSLSGADICLKDGLTVITGATNNGKSAIIRALESAVFNTGSDDYIKAGAGSLSVGISNGEHCAEYNRKIKGKTDKTTYVFDNGDTQQKVGRGQLPEMVSLFNIREVRLQNNQRAKLNFWRQGEPPFLMDKTAGQLYEFLSVSSSEKYLMVLKNMFSDIKQEETEIKEQSSAIDMLKKELSLKQDILDKNKDFPVIYGKVSTLKKEEEWTGKIYSIILSAEENRKEYSTKSGLLQRVSERAGIIPMDMVAMSMERLSADSVGFITLEKQLCDITVAGNKLSFNKENLSKVLIIDTVKGNGVSKLKPIFEHVLEMDAHVSILEKQQNICQVTEGHVLASRKKMKSLPSLLFDVTMQRIVQGRMSGIENKSRWVSDRRKDVSEVIAAASRMKTASDVLKDITMRLGMIDKELSNLKQQIGVCPFCGAIFTDNCN